MEENLCLRIFLYLFDEFCPVRFNMFSEILNRHKRLALRAHIIANTDYVYVLSHPAEKLLHKSPGSFQNLSCQRFEKVNVYSHIQHKIIESPHESIAVKNIGNPGRYRVIRMLVKMFCFFLFSFHIYGIFIV